MLSFPSPKHACASEDQHVQPYCRQAARWVRLVLVSLFWAVSLSPQAHATTKAGSVLATTGGALVGGTVGIPAGMLGYSVLRPPQCAPDDYHGCYYGLQMSMIGGPIGWGVFGALGATGAQALVRGGRTQQVFVASGITAVTGWSMISLSRHTQSGLLLSGGILVSTIGTPIAAGIAAAKGTYPTRKKKRRLGFNVGATPQGAHFTLSGRF